MALAACDRRGAVTEGEKQSASEYGQTDGPTRMFNSAAAEGLAEEGHFSWVLKGKAFHRKAQLKFFGKR